jgi:hypothetical protein
VIEALTEQIQRSRAPCIDTGDWCIDSGIFALAFGIAVAIIDFLVYRKLFATLKIIKEN